MTTARSASIITRLAVAVPVLAALLVIAAVAAMTTGSSGITLTDLFHPAKNGGELAATIIWKIRFPRVVLAATVGATLATSGLVLQALLRNPLAEPYILGVSGGAAIGAISASILGFSPFFGVPLSAFAGSMATLVLVIILSGGAAGRFSRESLLLGGVMVNALCSAVIMFLISITKSSQAHRILFWLMGDLSMFTADRMAVLAAILPCFVFIMIMARPMNLLLLGRESAALLGVNVVRVFYSLLAVTSFMVSLVVCQSGLIGFCGLVIPHILRRILGPDHRVLAPACLLGGGAFLVVCDLISRTLPEHGEMPVGVITAMIGAPLFIFLLWREKKC